MKDTLAGLNPAAIQPQIQALRAELLILTTSKSAATTRPALTPRTGRAPAHRAPS